ncbi:Panacea domain-containing protein [Undibacterium sp. Ji42W]|uniref:Panacea domain-containing protein n=1 Tax=Undibacterium sp. Ji42W TaxID=3413039 RepID=UPI003BF164EF
MFDPKSIANCFLELAAAEGQSIDPMKLQKLVYYAHGWYAGYRNAPLINENVEAWQYGPVIPTLYHEFKPFGAGPIGNKAIEYQNGTFREVPAPADPTIRQFLHNIWKSYGQYTGIRLSEMTHADGGPWDLTWEQTHGMHGSDIPFELIRQHFAEAVSRVNQQNHQGVN